MAGQHFGRQSTARPCATRSLSPSIKRDDFGLRCPRDAQMRLDAVKGLRNQTEQLKRPLAVIDVSELR